MIESNRWNDITLQQPPAKTWIVNKQKFNVKKFISTSNKIASDLESLSALHLESAILSRLIYRMKSKFRSDRGLKMMEKVNRALLNYLNMNFERNYSNFKECIEVHDDVVSLPSKQMLQFLLIRIQGFAKLMCRAEQVAMHAGHMLKLRIGMGHAWIVSQIAYAVISRIWILLRHVIKKSCNWYNNLYEYLDVFLIIGTRWLPEDIKLPENLKTWLNVPWFDETLPNIPMQENILQSVLNSVKVETEEWDNSISFDVEETEEPDNLGNEVTNKKVDDNMTGEIDFGKPIDRDDFDSDVGELEVSKVKKLKKRKLDDEGPSIKQVSMNKKMKKKKKKKNCGNKDLF